MAGAGNTWHILALAEIAMRSDRCSLTSANCVLQVGIAYSRFLVGGQTAACPRLDASPKGA